MLRIIGTRNDAPIHEHDCDKCIFLGNHESEYTGKVDLYLCPNEPTLISRFGPNGDYSSGFAFALNHDSLQEALKRAVRAGLVGFTVKHDQIEDNTYEKIAR